MLSKEILKDYDIGEKICNQLNKNNIVLVDNTKNIHTRLDLLKNIYAYILMFRKLELTDDFVIGIAYESKFEMISAFLACLIEEISFTVVNVNEDPEILLNQVSKSKTNLLLSDKTLTNFITTINSDFLIINLGSELKSVKLEQRLLIDALTESLQIIKQSIGTLFNFEEIHNSNLLKLSSTYKKINKTHYVNHHLGITTFNKSSIFEIKTIQLGLIKSMKQLNYKTGKNEIVFYSNNSLMLYDIINGIISPILQNCMITFNEDLYFSPTILYCNSAFIEKRVSKIRGGLYNFFNRLSKLKVFKKFSMLDIIKKSLLNNSYNKLYGNLRMIIITDKLLKTDYYHLADLVINLYVLGEVVSFVTISNLTKYNHDNFYNGFITDNHVIAGIKANPEEVFVYAQDSCIAYTNQAMTDYALLNTVVPGTIRTGDVGYIKDNCLYIIDKASLTFMNGKNEIISNTTIQEKVKIFGVFKHAVTIKYENKLYLFVDMDLSLSPTTFRYSTILTLCKNLKVFLNKEFENHFYFEDVFFYSSPKGMRTTQEKLIVRNFLSL